MYRSGEVTFVLAVCEVLIVFLELSVAARTDPELAANEIAYPSQEALANATSFDYLPEETSRYVENLFMEVRNG